MSSRQRLAAIVVTGVLIRLAFLGTHQVIERDGAVYASIAERLVHLGRFEDLRDAPHTFYPPAYPALVAAVYAIVGDSHRAGQIVSFVAGVALIVLVYGLGRRVASARVGQIAAFLTAMSPRLAHEAVSVHSESLYAALLCLLLLTCCRLLHRPTVVHAGLAGALAGMLYLTRPEGLLLAGAFVCVVVAWVIRGEPRVRVIGRTAVFAAVLAMFVLPYVAYLRATTGEWLVTGKGVSYRVAENPESESVKFGAPQERPWRGFRTEVAVFAERYARNEVRYEGLITESLSLFAVMLAAVGLAATPWRAAPAVESVLMASLAPLALYPAFEAVSRWTEPYTAVMFVYVGRGVVAVAGRAPGRWRIAVAAGALVLIGLRWAPQLAIPIRYTPAFEPVEQRAAAQWIAGRFGAGTPVMTRVPEVAYYARGRWVRMPVVPVERVVDAARRAGARVVVLDEPNTRGLRPELLPLLTETPPPGLNLVYQSDEFPGRRVRVFAVDPP